MDIKLLFILLIILLILLFLVKEMFTIKNLLKTTDLNQDNKFIKNKLNTITQEIKDYNNDLLIQAKKINKINAQKITSISNYYTEEESSGNRNLLEYLSDVKNTVVSENFKINYNDNSPVKNLEDINISSTSNSDCELRTVDNNVVSVNLNICDISQNNVNNTSDLSEISEISDIYDLSDNIVNTVLPEVITNQDNNNQDNNNQEKRDTQSVDTSNFVITTLGPLNTYTKTQLDKIAKRLSIPVTYIDGDIRKTYKKEELYLKINEILNKKSNE